MKYLFIILILSFSAQLIHAQDQEEMSADGLMSSAIFDDRALLVGYAQRYMDETRENLLAMIADDSLSSYKSAAAVRVFKVNFAHEVLNNDKQAIIKTLWHRLNHTDSAFVQVEIMHTLIILDRYQYFESMVRGLILKLDHYNKVVNDLAFLDLMEIIKTSNRTREARVIFNTLRKMLFLSRNTLAKVNEPDLKLQHKIDLLRWSIKILGTQELKRLPPELIRLL